VKDAFYFSHDSNARHDPKIIVLRAHYGYEGYGWYWAIIELLRDSKDYKFSLKNKYFLSSLAIDLGIDREKLDKFLNDCICEFELFKTDGEFVWSESLLERMYKRESIKQKRSEAGKKGAAEKWQTDGKNGKEDGKAIANNKNIIANDGKNEKTDGSKESKERKGKKIESKVKGTDETPYFFTFLNFDDPYFLRTALIDMMKYHCLEELEITKSVRTRLFNIIFQSVLPRDRCYKIALVVFGEYKEYPPEKKNFAYIFSRIEGKIKDAIIIYREELAELDKGKEKLEAEKMLHDNGKGSTGEENFSSILKDIINAKSIAEKKV